MKTRNLDPRRLIGHAIHDGQEVVLIADEVDLVRLDVDRQRVAFRAGVDRRPRLRREIDDGRIRARAADTYSLFVTGLSAVRLPRSVVSVSTIASVSGSMT